MCSGDTPAVMQGGVAVLTCADWGGGVRLGEGVTLQVWQAGRRLGLATLLPAAHALHSHWGMLLHAGIDTRQQ